MKSVLLVGMGGAVGSMLRYLTTLIVSSHVPSGAFPLGTFTVNVIGCFIIGIVFGLSERYDWLNPQLRLLLGAGFCGGYTTFSAFAFENMNLLQQGNFLTGFVYILTSVVFGLLAVFLGFAVVKLFF